MFTIVVAQNEQSRKPCLREKHLSLRLGDTPVSPTDYRTPAPIRDGYRQAVRERVRWAAARVGTLVAEVDLAGNLQWTAAAESPSGAEAEVKGGRGVQDLGMVTQALAELSMLLSAIYAALPQAQEHLSKEFQDSAELLGLLVEELQVTDEFWRAMGQRQARARALLASLLARTTDLV